MHICPVDLHDCAEADCRAEGCRLAAGLGGAEAVAMALAACDDCGVLVVAAARRVTCSACVVLHHGAMRAAIEED